MLSLTLGRYPKKSWALKCTIFQDLTYAYLCYFTEEIPRDPIKLHWSAKGGKIRKINKNRASLECQRRKEKQNKETSASLECQRRKEKEIA